MDRHYLTVKGNGREVGLVKLVSFANQWEVELTLGQDLCCFFASILVEKKQIQNEIAAINSAEIVEFLLRTIIKSIFDK